MAFSLDKLPAPAQPAEQIPTLPGATLADDCRASVSTVCGPWGRDRTATTDHERDALTQSLALWALEHPAKFLDRESGYPLAPHERRALLRMVLKRDLIRDTRGWLDSVQDRELSRTRPRKARVAISDETTAEQAERFRAHERARRPALQTSMEVLTERHRSSDGHIDWCEVAGHMDRETKAGEELSPLAVAESSRELAGAMAARIDEYLEERPQISLADRNARESVRYALLGASGEGLRAIADSERVSLPLAKKRSASGRGILRMLIGLGLDLVAVRRSCVADMLAADRESDPAAFAPRSVADVDALHGWGWARATTDRAQLIAERAAVIRGAGGSGETVSRERPRGSAREVLAYLKRIERGFTVAERPAWTYATDDARPAPAIHGLRVLSRATGPQLRTWADPAVSVLGSPTGNHPAAWYWPDRVMAGMPGYSPRLAKLLAPGPRDSFGCGPLCAGERNH